MAALGNSQIVGTTAGLPIPGTSTCLRRLRTVHCLSMGQAARVRVALQALTFVRCILGPQVFEYCETDLELVIKDRSLIFSAADVKAYLRMVLQGLAFCHDNWVLHRDIKPNNFLIAPSGVHLAALHNHTLSCRRLTCKAVTGAACSLLPRHR